MRRVGDVGPIALLCTVVAVALACATPASAGQAHATSLKASSAAGYSIIYHLNGGKQAANQTTTVKRGKALRVSKLKKPKRAGYTFVGWYTTKSLKKKAVAVTGKRAKAGRTLWAKWKPRKYTITYKPRGGTLKGSYAKSYTVVKKVAASKLPVPTRKGYSFEGWYTSTSFKKKVTSIPKGSTGNKVLYAKWSIVAYAITYNLNGGALAKSGPSAYTVKRQIASFPEPSRAGYAFMGWYSNKALTKKIDGIAAGTTGNKKLYAKWRARVLVAHRGYHKDVPANSIDAYRAAADAGFTYVETDVRFTADGVAVLWHDASITLAALGKDDQKLTLSVPISSLTYEQLQAVSMIKAPSGLDGANASRYDDFLKVCADTGLHPVIELKEGTEAQIKGLVDLAERYGVAANARWASFYTELLGYVNAYRPSADLGLITRTVSKGRVKAALKLAESGADVTISSSVANLTPEVVTLCKAAHLPLTVWTLADETSVPSYDSYICSFTVDGLTADKVPDLA